MESWRHIWPVETICRVMQISTRGYRSWRSRPVSQRSRTDMKVLAHIREQYSLSAAYRCDPVHGLDNLLPFDTLVDVDRQSLWTGVQKGPR